MRTLRTYGESIFWAIALIMLFFLRPSEAGSSLCFFRLIGFSSCPGCGIGHAIHYALHLEPAKSFHQHIMGIPATVILLLQVCKPLFNNKPKLIWTYNK